ncbi:MAG: GNAT family N-acetyltransferase [Thermoplasmata archaeon]
MPGLERFKNESFSFQKEGRNFVFRHAEPEDATEIQNLYWKIYGPNYHSKYITEREVMLETIQDPSFLWLLCCDGKKVVGSVLFIVDAGNRLAKTFGAAVSQEYRGLSLMENMTRFGIDIILEKARIADTVYATTRTLLVAPQRITEKLGFKKLGIFPNVKKVKEYETHTLAVYFAPHALAKRYTKIPGLPPEVHSLYRIAAEEVGLPALPEIGEQGFYGTTQKPALPEIKFEVIEAPKYIKRHFEECRKAGIINIHLFSFHTPNLLLCSTDGLVEVFIYFEKEFRHCAIIGDNLSKLYYDIYLDAISKLMYDLGAMYIELLVPAEETDMLFKALKARFIPCAYYPCMRYVNGYLRDYVVLSRTFEAFDFMQIKLVGRYSEYLKHYVKVWSKFYLRKEGV